MEIQECTASKRHRNEKKPSRLTELETYTFSAILGFLNLTSILQLRMTNRTVKQKVSRNEVWCQLLVTKFLPGLEEPNYDKEDKDSLSAYYTNSLLFPKLTNLKNRHSPVWSSHFFAGINMHRENTSEGDYGKMTGQLTKIILKSFRGTSA